MVRKLKYHEQKLLRKVDFIEWKSDHHHREAAIIRRYNIQKPGDYAKYNTIVGSLRQLAHKLSLLPPDDAVRHKHEKLLLDKLYDTGLVATTGKLSAVEGLSVAAFCRRRLAVVMTRLHMAETVQAATKIIEQGHVRIGDNVITDPAYLVTRNLEDFVTWVDSSKIKRNILQYRDKLDDFDLL